MTRNALYFSILAVWIALCLGWAIGVVFSKRLNTTAIQAYMDARDLENAALRLDEVSASQLEATAAKLATAKADAACSLKIDADTTALNAVRARDQAILQQQAVDYSERIDGLRMQLRLAHVPAHVVQATR